MAWLVAVVHRGSKTSERDQTRERRRRRRVSYLLSPFTASLSSSFCMLQHPKHKQRPITLASSLSRARAPAQASMLLSGTAHYPKLVRTTHMSSHVGPTDRNPWLRCTQAQRDASSSRRCRPVPKVVPNTPSRAVIPSPPPSRPAMRRGRAECPPRPHPSWRTALGHVAAARRTQGRLPRACSPERETRR